MNHFSVTLGRRPPESLLSHFHRFRGGVFGLFFVHFLDAAFLLTVGSFLLAVEHFYLQLTISAFLLRARAFSLFVTYNFSFFTYSWSFFAYSGEVRLISTFRYCKQRSLAVSKKIQL